MSIEQNIHVSMATRKVATTMQAPYTKKSAEILIRTNSGEGVREQKCHKPSQIPQADYKTCTPCKALYMYNSNPEAEVYPQKYLISTGFSLT